MESGRLKVLISLSFIAESQSICSKLNMDLFFKKSSFSNFLIIFFITLGALLGSNISVVKKNDLEAPVIPLVFLWFLFQLLNSRKIQFNAFYFSENV